MKHNRIVPGAILITLGVIFLLHSFGLIHIHWINIIHLWPIFLLIAGINLIFAHNRSVWATFLKLVVVVVGVCLLLFGNFGNGFNTWSGYYHFRHLTDRNDDDNSDDNEHIVKIEGSSIFTEPFHADAKIGKLNISGGGVSYILVDTTSQLFEATTKEYGRHYEYSHHNQDSTYVFDFNVNSNARFHWGKGKTNEAVFKLNTAPLWDMDIEAGAAKINFDLSKFKIRNVDISGGAASFQLKMGQPLANTNLSVSTGAAEVRISVPKSAACKIETDSGLSSNNFEGFNKLDDDSYETPGFAGAKNKLYIKFDGGVSDFKVVRY